MPIAKEGMDIVSLTDGKMDRIKTYIIYMNYDLVKLTGFQKMCDYIM